MATEETTKRPSDDSDGIAHIKYVSQQRATVLRMKDDLKLLKANLKVAEEEFNLALAGMANYAERQLAFRL